MAAPADLVPHLVATFDPASCPSCSLFDFCRSELRANADPESLLVELGVPVDARPHVIGLVDGTGEASDAAPPGLVALITATVKRAAYRTGQYRVDPAGEPCTVNVVVAKSDAAALGVHGLGHPGRHRERPGRLGVPRFRQPAGADDSTRGRSCDR